MSRQGVLSVEDNTPLAPLAPPAPLTPLAGCLTWRLVIAVILISVAWGGHWNGITCTTQVHYTVSGSVC